MATSAAVSDKNKSAPDLAKLGEMTNRVVQVTKHLSRTGAGQLVVPAWKGVTVDQVVELQTKLPREHGPGTYSFEVYDEGGPGKDQWTVRLGPETPEASAMPRVEGGSNGSTLYSRAVEGHESLGVRDLGGGYRYDESLGLLITPDKQIHQWRPGEDLPGRLPKPQQPWWMQSTPGAPGAPATPYGPGFNWGNIPVDKDDDNRAKLLEEQLKEERRAREEAERRREQQELIARIEKQREEDAKRFEALLAKLSEKPSGPSPEMIAIQEQNKKLEQQAEQARRDAEQARRDAEQRSEMQAMREMIAKASENKPDPMAPMVSMLGQIMSNGQSSQAEVVKAMRDAATAQAQSAERNAMTLADRLSGSIMTPVQIVELMKKGDEGAGAINKSMVEMFQNLFGMAQGLVREQAQMYAEGGGPAWLPIAQEGVQTLGRVAQMYAQAKASTENSARRAEQAARVQMMREQAAAQQAGLAGPVAPRPQAPQPRQPLRASEAEREAAASRVFPRTDPNTPQGQRDALAKELFQREAQQPEYMGADVEEDGDFLQEDVDPTASEQAPEQTPEQAPEPAQTAAPAAPEKKARKPRKPRKSRKRTSAAQQQSAEDSTPAAPTEAPATGAVIQPDGSVIPASTARQVANASDTVPVPPVDPENASEEQIEAANQQAAEANPDALREVVNEMSDEDFFGPALPDVQELRQKLQTAPGDITPTDIAQFILTARQQLLNFGIFPPAAEMLDLGHVEILVERLLPDAPPQAHKIVVQHTRVLMEHNGLDGGQGGQDAQ